MEGGEIREYMLDIIACAPHIKPERYYGMSCWHSIYRKEIIKKNKIRFPTERSVASEDLPFQIDFLMNSERIIYLPNCFYHYCFKDGSFTTVFDKDYFDKLKKLHSLLKSKLGDETVCLQRIDRFFIGFVRTYLLKLVGSKTKEKQEAIKSVVNDKIWQEIKQRYSPSWLPIYQNICLRLIYRKDVIALLWYLKTIIWVKRLNQICISIK